MKIYFKIYMKRGINPLKAKDASMVTENEFISLSKIKIKK